MENNDSVDVLQEGLQTIHYTGQVAKLLSISHSTVKKSISDLGLDIETSMCGTVSRRTFCTKDLFELAVKKRDKSRKDPAKKLKIFIVWNEKGGVGKSSFTREFATILGLKGFRVLVVDADPQNSLTTMFGYNAEIDEEIAREYGIPDNMVIKNHFGNLLELPPLFRRSKAPIFSEMLKKPFGEYGPHLIPSNESLSSLSYSLEKDPYGATVIGNTIRRALKTPSDDLDLSDYDIMIFDCNPSKTALIDALYYASDFLVIPVRLDALSVKGVSQALDVRDAMASKGVENVPYPLIVGNMYKAGAARCSRNYSRLAEMYPSNLVSQTIRESEDMNKALEDSLRVPVTLAAPSSKLTSDLFAVTEEILKKCGI